MDRKEFLVVLGGSAGLAMLLSTDLNPNSNSRNQGNQDDALINADSLKNKSDTADVKKDAEIYPAIENSLLEKRIELVRANALKNIPVCAPYIDRIIAANIEYQDIYPVPIEYNIAQIRQESLYDKRALSIAGALGLGQMMRSTAEGLGMKTYDPKQFPEQFKNETYLKENTRKLYSLNTAVMNNLKANNFSNVKKYKLRKDQLKKDLNNVFIETVELYKELNEEHDDRINPDIMINFSVKHLAQLCLKCQKQFGGNMHHNICRGIAAYNSGNNAFKYEGLPYLEETVKYLRKVWKYADMAYPGYDLLHENKA